MLGYYEMIRIVIKCNAMLWGNINKEQQYIEKKKSINNFVYHQIHCSLRSINWTHLMNVCLVCCCAVCVVIIIIFFISNRLHFIHKTLCGHTYTDIHTCFIIFAFSIEKDKTDTDRIERNKKKHTTKTTIVQLTILIMNHMISRWMKKGERDAQRERDEQKKKNYYYYTNDVKSHSNQTKSVRFGIKIYYNCIYTDISLNGYVQPSFVYIKINGRQIRVVEMFSFNKVREKKYVLLKSSK